MRDIGSEAGTSAQRYASGEDDDLDSDEPSKVYHRAITSLFAGTAPEASQLNGKVCLPGLSKFPLTLPTYRTLKNTLSVSHRLGTRHTSK
jgi:hypothetical protein